MSQILASGAAVVLLGQHDALVLVVLQRVTGDAAGAGGLADGAARGFLGRAQDLAHGFYHGFLFGEGERIFRSSGQNFGHGLHRGFL